MRRLAIAFVVLLMFVDHRPTIAADPKCQTQTEARAAHPNTYLRYRVRNGVHCWYGETPRRTQPTTKPAPAPAPAPLPHTKIADRVPLPPTLPDTDPDDDEPKGPPSVKYRVDQGFNTVTSDDTDPNEAAKFKLTILDKKAREAQEREREQVVPKPQPIETEQQYMGPSPRLIFGVVFITIICILAIVYGARALHNTVGRL